MVEVGTCRPGVSTSRSGGETTAAFHNKSNHVANTT